MKIKKKNIIEVLLHSSLKPLTFREINYVIEDISQKRVTEIIKEIKIMKNMEKDML